MSNAYASFEYSIQEFNPKDGLYVIYKVVLTGDNETPVLEDIELVVSSIRIILRSNGTGYISAQIPNYSTTMIEDVVARSNGLLKVTRVLYRVGGKTHEGHTVTVPYTDFRYDQGANSMTLTISGSGSSSSTKPEPTTVELLKVYRKYNTASDSILYVNYDGDPLDFINVFPSDIVTYKGDSGTVDTITIAHSGTQYIQTLKVTA